MRKKNLLPILLSAFIFLSFFSYITFIKRIKGFSIKKILSHHPYNSRWDFGTPTQEQEELLDQIASDSFTLLGSGKECYAFVNEAGTIVIKFFKQKHMRTQSILNHIPLAPHLKLLHQETITRRSHHRNRLFSSYQIAYEHLPSQTGLLYLHLNKTKHLRRTIRLIEPSGREHLLELDKMEFLLQKRATSILDSLTSLMEKNRGDAVRATIASILDHIAIRRELGIGDDDINCERNLGLIDGAVVQIDVGEFFLSLPSTPSREEYSAATEDLRQFLEPRSSELAIFLKSEIERRSRVL
ncbi:MAG: hypothetical protein K1060chlam2_01501 [Chlamydiae bacterium]|nr:hypothetical protein [Chlamydiota bacterium]